MRLMPRHDGWGVRSSNLISELCGLAGIKNISIKVGGWEDQCLWSQQHQDSMFNLHIRERWQHAVKLRRDPAQSADLKRRTGTGRAFR